MRVQHRLLDADTRDLTLQIGKRQNLRAVLVRAGRKGILARLLDGHLAHVFTQTLHLALAGLAFSFEQLDQASGAPGFVFVH